MLPEWFIPEIALQVSLVLPLVAMGLVVVTGERFANLRDTLTVVVAILTFGTVCTLVEPVMNGQRPRGLAVCASRCAHFVPT